MKSYTDIEQSRKLAEILPLESADMWFANGIVVARDSVEEPADIKSVVPCWSLAALLSVIPYNVSFNKALYEFKLVKSRDHWECYHENFGTVSTNIFKADNPIDACYAMILKLHEQTLL